MEIHYGICIYMTLLDQCILSELTMCEFLFSVQKTSKELHYDMLLASFTFQQNKINNFSLLCLLCYKLAVI